MMIIKKRMKVILLYFFIILVSDIQNDLETTVDACPNVNNKKMKEEEFCFFENIK
jgi:hypothetical protein